MAKRKPAENWDNDPPPENERPMTTTPAVTTTATTTSHHSEAAAQNGNGQQERKPIKTFSALVAKDTWVFASVWDRFVQMPDYSFVAYDVSVAKLYKDKQTGKPKRLYSFHSSEVYAVIHVMNLANAFILALRGETNPLPTE